MNLGSWVVAYLHVLVVYAGSFIYRFIFSESGQAFALESFPDRGRGVCIEEGRRRFMCKN